MKKHTIKKAFLTFAFLIMLFYSVFSVSVFATPVHDGGITDLTGYKWVGMEFLNIPFGGSTYNVNFVSNNTSYSSITLNGVQPQVKYNNIEVFEEMNYWTNNSFRTIVFLGGADINNATFINWLQTNGTLSLASTPTPSPTPTPTPTSQIATPTPDPEATGIPFPTSTSYPQPSPLTSDTEFWERMGANANGAWGVITSTVSGIFSNVVMRNLAIYIPLFGLIVGLIIYTITLGGGDDN